MKTSVITVSQLNSYIKACFECDENLKNIFVVGEISNFRVAASGHLYFSLKDEKSIVHAVMFSSNAKNISFDIKDGISVMVKGKVSCYEISGQYQIYVQQINPYGVGAVHLAYEKLKSKLSNEGIFDEKFKKSIPKYPKKIGVITSKTGAVIHDIKNVISRRYPICEISLYPVNVQGEKSSEQIVNGINYFNINQNVDVIVIGRGGGSIEDLWAFNKEEVARAIFASSIPIISAVGHETDVTICDFAADKRASTPSVAAEISVPDINNLKEDLKSFRSKIFVSLKAFINFKENNLYNLKLSLNKKNITDFFDFQSNKIADLKSRLNIFYKNYLEKKRLKLDKFKKVLDAYSQELILKRGYSILFDDKGKNLKSVDKIPENAKVKIVLSDGVLECNLINIQKISKEWIF
ncbi:MAG: exodeoxyribonuclease VII large subunit [Clostridia bacterium]|nr:exodeoxyribonuclease VII large subunit [Clostridia bacterium]